MSGFLKRRWSRYAFQRKTMQIYKFTCYIVYNSFLPCFLHINHIHTFIDQAASVHSEEAIYNLSITSSGEDICTPEMLGRQELISRPEISHKIRTLSNTYKSLLYLANISDTIHIPLYQGLSEYISVACEPRSTAFIIDYIHMKDGKKKI